MTLHPAVAAGLVLWTSAAASAEILPHFDPQSHTWKATHIVVVGDGKVIESWKGNLKAGDALPDGIARFTRIALPGPDPWRKISGEPEPVITGRRMLLFLSHEVPFGDDKGKRDWLGACSCHPYNEVSAAASMAWIEGDAAYSVYQPINPGGSRADALWYIHRIEAACGNRPALRTRFEAAKAEKVPEKRAGMLVDLTPMVSKYAGYYGQSDCVEELGKCGSAAVPHLVRWATEERGPYWSEALYALSRLGDVGFDAMVKILDVETDFWRGVAENLCPGETVRESLLTNVHAWRNPNHLYHVLSATQGMKLSAANRERLRKHTGLLELDKLCRTKRGMKPEKSDMEVAHRVLQEILAGKFRTDD